MSRKMGAVAVPTIDRQSLHKLEAHFIAPEIYQRDDVRVRQAKIARIASNEIIPRLLRLHTEVVADAPPVAVLIEALAPSNADVSALADIVLGTDLEAAASYVMVLRDRGLSMETLFVELLEPAARHLGEMWDNDECDFIDVTLGVGRLQKLLAVFNETYEEPAYEARRQVLMAVTPGNQHSFGVAIVERFLLAAGWQVQTELSSTAEEIVGAARSNWFAVAGLTAGSDQQVNDLKSIISRIRKQSQNRMIGIMVGGPMFTANPAMALAVGADATAPNAPTAVLVAQKLFDLAMPSLRAN
jgi:methanogenic corrinoid protein MtbC1